MNGCKYPGTPEPCEGYREILERSEEVGRANIDEIDRLTTLLRQYEEGLTESVDAAEKVGKWLSAALEEDICDEFREDIDWYFAAMENLTRINRLKDMDQLREKEL